MQTISLPLPLLVPHEKAGKINKCQHCSDVLHTDHTHNKYLRVSLAKGKISGKLVSARG